MKHPNEGQKIDPAASVACEPQSVLVSRGAFAFGCPNYAKWLIISQCRIDAVSRGAAGIDICHIVSLFFG